MMEGKGVSAALGQYFWIVRMLLDLRRSTTTSMTEKGQDHSVSHPYETEIGETVF